MRRSTVSTLVLQLSAACSANVLSTSAELSVESLAAAAAKQAALARLRSQQRWNAACCAKVPRPTALRILGWHSTPLSNLPLSSRRSIVLVLV